VAGVAILSIGGQAQESQEKKDLEQRVEDLETQLAAVQGQLAGLNKSLEAETIHIDSLLEFARAQSKSAGELAGTLTRSEQAGFTAGINYTSREILLKGWHQQLAAVQKSAPAAAKKPEAKKKTSRR
jgi:uncharacterized coiled-coil protein SlyX